MEISEREIKSLFILSSVYDKRLVGGGKGPVKRGGRQSKRVLLGILGGGEGGGGGGVPLGQILTVFQTKKCHFS